jgi:hypothetical protein
VSERLAHIVDDDELALCGAPLETASNDLGDDEPLCLPCYDRMVMAAMERAL